VGPSRNAAPAANDPATVERLPSKVVQLARSECSSWTSAVSRPGGVPALPPRLPGPVVMTFFAAPGEVGVDVLALRPDRIGRREHQGSP
jgi:hypothetical protein